MRYIEAGAAAARLAVDDVEVLVGEEAEGFVDVVVGVECRDRAREVTAPEVGDREAALLCAVERVEHAENDGLRVTVLELRRLLHARTLLKDAAKRRRKLSVVFTHMRCCMCLRA